MIPEGGLYRLITRSELPSAERFEAWVFDDVFPSVRQNGGYIAGQDNLEDKALLAKALVTARNILDAKDKEIEELQHKGRFFDAVTDSKTAVEMAAVAKLLDVGIGRNKLFEILRKERILMYNNQPYQKYVDRGYFRVIEQRYTKPDGETIISLKMLVYQRGIDYINRLLREKYGYCPAGC